MTVENRPSSAPIPQIAWVAEGQWRELSDECAQAEQLSRIVRIRAADLGRAKRMAAAERARAAREGRDVRVFLDLEFHVAADARAAFDEVGAGVVDAASAMPAPTVRYIGTSSGVVCLLRDMSAAGVSDGVTLLPLLVADQLVVGTLLAARSVPARAS